MYAGEFRLTPSAGAKLSALLTPLARPRIDTLPTSSAADADDNARTLTAVDERTFGQRQHDALEEICDRVLQAGDVVGVGGTPATVIVTIGLEELTEKLGYGTTSDGTLLSTREVLTLAAEAEIIPTVLNRSGAVLDLGRTRRIASNSQTQALNARDHGCSFPACDRPPEWCERHHIIEWIDGGPTNLNNLTLLCRHHHHNFAGRGWTCHINPDGLPEWQPPRWVDRDQKPLINSRITAQLDTWRQRRQPKTRARRDLSSSGLSQSCADPHRR
jgi:hypothetical protein